MLSIEVDFVLGEEAGDIEEALVIVLAVQSMTRIMELE